MIRMPQNLGTSGLERVALWAVGSSRTRQSKLGSHEETTCDFGVDSVKLERVHQAHKYIISEALAKLL